MDDKSNIPIKQQILLNQEKRTIEINELENYFKKLLIVMEEELNEGKKLGNWDYNTKTQNFMKSVSSLNSFLRKIQEETDNQYYKNAIEQLLGFEKHNFEKTIAIFQSKLKELNLIQKTHDFTKIDSGTIDVERNISLLEEEQKKIRENINDLISEIKYSD